MDILNAIRNGEEGGIETLYRKYFNVIEVFVYKNKGIYDEAKDIAQETAIVFYEKARKPDFELTCALQTYLYSIARNLWLKELKRKGKTPMVIDTTSNYLTFEQTDEVAHKEEDEELIQKCMRYVNTLGENCKEILTHYYWDKWKMDKIAKEMDYTNAANAKNQKAKCMKRLRELCSSLKKM
ncbi:RNA polymerase subunit sigma-70 [Sphingobacteriales bacterium UPWRP_1]|nr:RNA polymerase subunit sigma-70 [Sphingobacteriales bacterium UPWRP_1]